MTLRTVPRPTRRFGRLVAGSVGLALLASACGSDDETGTSSPTPVADADGDAPTTPDAAPATHSAPTPDDPVSETRPRAERASLFEVLDDPRMVDADAASWLDEDDVVMGVVHNGEAQAFPIEQMAYHHIANTEIAGEPYLVTY